MKIKQFFILVLLLTALSVSSQSKNYFISPSGDDGKSGLSIKEAWKSLDKVNQAVFQPGDKILFEAGGIWYGQLKPQGSGSKGESIVLSSYGDGSMPIINIGSAEGAAIRLTNQSWWEISNMEITSGAQPETGIGRQGIVAKVQSGTYVQHIVVKNCFIHDIWGQLGGKTEYTGYNSCAIMIAKPRRDTTCSLNDVQIENNRIERFDKVGIIVDGGKENIIVRNNQMDNLGGDGIIIGGSYRGMIEYNIARRTCMRSGNLDLPGDDNWWPHTAAIWIHDCEETVMQFNEVYDTGRETKNGDGEAYDFDFNCKRCICQFNYSKNNHGLLLIMYNTFENICRYNISENDRTHLVQVQSDLSERNLIYNNVFYVDYGTSDLDFFCGDDNSRDRNKLGAQFFNNIFYATGQGRFRTVYTSGYAWDRTFDENIHGVTPEDPIFKNNCYFGPWKNGLPEDPQKIMADPMFVAPGTGGNGIETLEGYKLKPGSPCINTGIPIPLNSEIDFYGNPVSNGPTDVGVYEQIGSGAFGDPQTIKMLDETYKAKSALAWAKATFPKKLSIKKETNNIVISLKEPLEETISGTLTFHGNDLKIRPESMDINKTTGTDFIFRVKSEIKSPLTETVSIKLKCDSLTEEWEIPVTDSDNNPK